MSLKFTPGLGPVFFSLTHMPVTFLKSQCPRGSETGATPPGSWRRVPVIRCLMFQVCIYPRQNVVAMTTFSGMEIYLKIM